MAKFYLLRKETLLSHPWSVFPGAVHWSRSILLFIVSILLFTDHNKNKNKTLFLSHLRFKSEPEIQYWQNRQTGGACMGVMVVWRTLEWLKLGLSLAGQHDWVFYPVLWPIQLGRLSQRQRFVQHQPAKPKHAQSDSDQQTHMYTKHVNKKT